jgi:hypothetical protein
VVAVDRVGSAYIGEVYYIRHNTNQRWYWLQGMNPSEVAVFVSFDSENQWCGMINSFSYRNGSATDREFKLGIPHTSFTNPNPPRHAKPRESLEVRLIVGNDTEQV